MRTATADVIDLTDEIAARPEFAPTDFVTRGDGRVVMDEEMYLEVRPGKNPVTGRQIFTLEIAHKNTDVSNLVGVVRNILLTSPYDSHHAIAGKRPCSTSIGPEWHYATFALNPSALKLIRESIVDEAGNIDDRHAVALDAALQTASENVAKGTDTPVRASLVVDRCDECDGSVDRQGESLENDFEHCYYAHGNDCGTCGRDICDGSC